MDISEALIKLVPERDFGWIHRSFALHELERREEAFAQLLSAAKAVPNSWVIRYNLACYCAQLGRLEDAKKWFQKATTIDDKAPAKAALDDPDLKPLWESMAGTLWKRNRNSPIIGDAFVTEGRIFWEMRTSGKPKTFPSG